MFDEGNTRNFSESLINYMTGDKNETPRFVMKLLVFVINLIEQTDVNRVG